MRDWDSGSDPALPAVLRAVVLPAVFAIAGALPYGVARGQDGLVPTGDVAGASDSAPVWTVLDEELQRLRRERDSVAAARDAALPLDELASEAHSRQRAELKQQLQRLVSDMAQRPEPRKAATGDRAGERSRITQRAGADRPVRSDRSKSAPNDRVSAAARAEVKTAPIDPLALAQALFRLADYQGALDAFQLSQKSAVNPRDRVVHKYFIAACQARLGNQQESVRLFREVANSKADDVFAECARWQLAQLQWREATAARIAALRAQPTSAETSEPADQPPELPSEASEATGFTAGE